MHQSAHTDLHVPTFADDRDDEYFAQLCPPELIARITQTAQAAHDASFPARSAAYDEAYSAKVKTETQTIRAAARHAFENASEDGRLLYDDDKRSFRAYVPDAVDYNPLPESIEPEARVYRGVTVTGVEIQEPDHDRTYTPSELLAHLLEAIHPTVFFKSPTRSQLGVTRSQHDDSTSAIEDRLHMDDEEFSFVHRDEDEAVISHRWNRDEDDLEALDMIAEESLQYLNIEVLTAIRRAQLHRLCRWYFDTDDYRDREIVLKWQEVAPRKFRPLVKMNVLAWIEMLVNGTWKENEDGTWEQQGDGSQLTGFASAVFSMKRRIQLRDASALPQRILSTEEVREIVHRLVAACSQEAEDTYFEL